jgi:hypothetical protein
MNGPASRFPTPLSSDAPSLADLQRWFQAVIVHPGGVIEGAQSDEARTALEADAIGKVVAPSSRQSAEERVAVYAQGYWSRLLECLREEFPVVRAAVGDEAFDSLAVDFLQAQPPTSYTLGKLGAGFPTHLAATSPGDEWSAAVVELARFERTITEVFDLPGGETLGYLTLEELNAVAPQDRATLRLAPLPTVRLLGFAFDVNTWFTQLRAGDATSVPERRPTFVALSRREFVVRRLTLSHVQFDLLGSLFAGEPLDAALQTTLARHPTADDEVAANLGPWFADWAKAGLFGRLAAALSPDIA